MASLCLPMAVDRLKWSVELMKAVAAVGRGAPAKPEASHIECFASYFTDEGVLDVARLDDRDGGVTRREAILRFLLLSAVVDQGPDIEGLRAFVVQTTNRLYREETRIFHQPLDFFSRFNLAVSTLEEVHETVKRVRSGAWATANGSNAAKYLLYMENAGQTLGYAVYRWGAPLILPYVLELRAQENGGDAATALSDYLREPTLRGGPSSAELMSRKIKDDPTYGLGKAIGPKAAHLFAKWAVFSYPLLRSDVDTGWGRCSFETPFDSNAGRVLYRTGFLGAWTTPAELKQWQVLQAGKGKGGKTYLRVTNLRSNGSAIAAKSTTLQQLNKSLVRDHLRTKKGAARKVELQHLPSALSLHDGSFSPGEIDDGLIRIGTTWCLNHERPKCSECPLRRVCSGALSNPDLIASVRT